MESVKIILSIIIYSSYLAFFLKACWDKNLLEGVVICSTFSLIASISGLEGGKSFITLLLYGVLFFSSLKAKSYSSRIKTTETLMGLLLTMATVTLVLLNILKSPATGYEYFNEKVILFFINILIPVFLIALFGGVKGRSFKIIFFYFEVMSLLAATLLLVNAYEKGLYNILSSTFFTRINVGESNVIWTGRLISIGFLVVLLKRKGIVSKTLKISFLALAMLLTGSKSVVAFPLIAILGYNFFFFAKNDRGNRFGYSFLIIAIGAGYLVLMSFLNPKAVERRYSLQSGTIDMREGYATDVIDNFYVRENFLIGNGFATSGYPIAKNYEARKYPHNIVLEVLYEFGTIGLLLFLFIFLLPYILFLRSHRSDKNIALLLTIYTLYLLFSQTSGDITGNSMLFVLTAYLFTTISYCNDTKLDIG